MDLGNEGGQIGLEIQHLVTGDEIKRRVWHERPIASIKDPDVLCMPL